MEHILSLIRRSLVALTVFGLLAGGAAHAETTYSFGISGQRTNITFESETDFEVILGSTNEISGEAVADWDKGSAKISLSVPVASLNTGIEMRDDHLRSPMWLDAARYPKITFSSTSAELLEGTKVAVVGTFTMHGVSREIKVTADVRRIPAEAAKRAGLEDGEWVRVSVPFELKLSDFGVAIPEMAAAKVNDSWKVKMLAFAGTGK